MSKKSAIDGPRAYRDQRSSSAPNVNQVVYNGGGGNENMNLEVSIFSLSFLKYFWFY